MSSILELVGPVAFPQYANWHAVLYTFTILNFYKLVILSKVSTLLDPIHVHRISSHKASLKRLNN